MYLLTISSDNLCFKWWFEPGGLTGKACQKWEAFMALRGDREKWNETGDHTVGRGELAGLYDSELRLYLLIWILNIITKDANFEKLNTVEMWYQILPYFSLSDNQCFQELSSAEECWKEFSSLSRLLTLFI